MAEPEITPRPEAMSDTSIPPAGTAEAPPGPARETAADKPLDQWILDHVRSEAYRAKIEAVQQAPGGLTSLPDEVALLCDVIEHLRVDLAVEIGSLFGQTSRQMAEAVAGHGGKLITIDPYGGHRLPDIIAGWPEPLQAVTEFRPVFSMELFARLAEREIEDNARPTLGVVYVDGNHRFEYAFYDIMEAAAGLMPGGAIFVDDMDQEGPRLAVLQFLRLNPAWKLYYRGRIWSAPITARDLLSTGNADVGWGTLIAPAAIQVAMKGRSFRGRLERQEVITGLQLNTRAPLARVELRINLIYSAWAYDFHITGEGVSALRREESVEIGPGDEAIQIVFDPALALPPPSAPANVIYELDITVLDETNYVLLDPQLPFEFRFDRQAD